MLKEIMLRAVVIVSVYYVLGFALSLTFYPEFKPQLAFAVGLAFGNMFITFIRLKYFPTKKSVL